MTDTCFVIMPFGKKKDANNKTIDFDDVYQKMIFPAVESVEGLKCIRCDDIEKPGSIQERMLRHIFEADVAVVDTSTMNANVFYELGVRHTLRRSGTILIHQANTPWPFNLSGFDRLEYSPTPAAMDKAGTKIASYIKNVMSDPTAIDSIVHHALPDLRVQRVPEPITRFETIAFPIKSKPEIRVGVVTGDREDINNADIWVSSENTNMQIDSFFGRSTSATIRYLGSKRDFRGIVEDTIGDALKAKLGDVISVDPATVIDTTAGTLLETNNVRCIFHVAAVYGEPREGYRPVSRLDRCVKNALRLVGRGELKKEGLQSILFPVFGTGPAGGRLRDHAEICINSAIEYLETSETSLKAVYFYAWSDIVKDTCFGLMRENEALETSPDG